MDNDELIERLRAESERVLDGTAPATEEALRTLQNAGMANDFIVANVLHSVDGALDALREVCTTDKVGPRTAVAIGVATWTINRCLQDVIEEHVANCPDDHGEYTIRSVDISEISDPSELPDDMPDAVKGAVRLLLKRMEDDARGDGDAH
jgi:hypothetical protein